jgi:hypothetical protein
MVVALFAALGVFPYAMMVEAKTVSLHSVNNLFALSLGC